MKKFLSFLLILTMVLAMVPYADGHEVSITLLHTNDMHGFFQEGRFDGMGAAKMATYINSVRAENPNTLLLDAGDALQGHNIVTVSNGEEGTKVMNALGYDAMTLGNHEFDYGSAQTLKLAGMLNFPMLAANVKNEDGSNFVDPYKIFTVGEVKVGVFGLATPETYYKSHPDNTKGLTIGDIKTNAQEAVTALKAEGAQVIIGLVHLGDEGDLTSESVINAVEGIDVMIDGHSHSAYDEGKVIGSTLLVSAGEKTKNVGRVDLKVADGKVTSKTAMLFTKDMAADLDDNAEVKAVVDAIVAANAVLLDKVVASAPFMLDGEKAMVRAGETNLGNLLTEALLDISKADVAFTNGGGIRASIAMGDVTVGDVLTVLPFGNTVRVIELTGADLVAAIENGVDSYPEAKGAFPHIAGMTVVFDPEKPAGSRVMDLMVGGMAVDLSKTYTLATNDFLVAGGDGYGMFTGKSVVAEYGAMDEVLIDYIAANGFVMAKTDGRIKAYEAPTTTYTVVLGDVLWKIAKMYNTTWEKLADMNMLENPHLIFPGQVFKVPMK